MGTKIRRTRLDLVTAAARTISAFTVYYSTIEIGSAYHHSNDTIRLTNAVADYKVDSAGLRKMREDVDAAQV